MSLEPEQCPICERPLTPNAQKHHLIPKTFKGKKTVQLHPICHRKIHSLFTERELYNYYHTIDRLINHPDIVKFIKWVKKKDPEFYSKTKESKRKNN